MNKLETYCVEVAEENSHINHQLEDWKLREDWNVNAHTIIVPQVSTSIVKLDLLNRSEVFMLAFRFYFMTMIGWFSCPKCKSLHQSLSFTLKMFAFEAKFWICKINRKVCPVLRQPRICIASKSNDLYNAKLLLWVFKACIMERLVHKKRNTIWIQHHRCVWGTCFEN